MFASTAMSTTSKSVRQPSFHGVDDGGDDLVQLADIDGNVDAQHAAWRGRDDAREEGLVRGKPALALLHLNVHFAPSPAVWRRRGACTSSVRFFPCSSRNCCERRKARRPSKSSLWGFPAVRSVTTIPCYIGPVSATFVLPLLTSRADSLKGRCARSSIAL